MRAASASYRIGTLTEPSDSQQPDDASAALSATIGIVAQYSRVFDRFMREKTVIWFK